MQVESITSNTQVIQVAVGVLIRGSGARRKVFVTRRGAHQHQGGLLEFPGGKFESGESVELAMARELHEELGIVFGERTTLTPLIEIPWVYGAGAALKKVHLHVVEVQHWEGEPHGVEAEEAAWMPVSELDPCQFPAANRGIIIALQTAVFVQITPEYPPLPRSPTNGTAPITSGFARGRSRATTDRSVRLGMWLQSPKTQRLRNRLSILLRARHLSAGDYARQAALLQCLLTTGASGGSAIPMGVYLDHGEGGGLSAGDLTRWLQMFPARPNSMQSLPPASAFVHLTTAHCEYWGDRLGIASSSEEFYGLANESSVSGGYSPLRTALKLPDFCLLSASVHTREALWQAVLLGVDQVFMSPVSKTLSHPDVKPLGWSRFQRLIRECPVPAYALGGLSDQDLDTAIDRGGQGIATIRGFGLSEA